MLRQRDRSRSGLHAPVASQAVDAALYGVARDGTARADFDLHGVGRDTTEVGNFDANVSADVYVAGPKGPYLHDTERGLYGPDEPPETRQIRSDIRIFFTTALAFVVLMITIYFHITEG
ncbi:MAG: hypothetical protein ACNA7O_05580 [Rhodobacterales bacterium]